MCIPVKKKETEEEIERSRKEKKCTVRGTVFKK